MATFRAMAGAAVIFAGMMIPASAVHACDERYPATCKPAASKASSEPAESRKATSKPLQITSRRRGISAKSARAATAKAATERSAQVSRKRLARKAAVRRLAARSRSAKAEAAEVDTHSSTAKTATKAPSEAMDVSRMDSRQRSLRVADGSSEANSGFASVWKERTIVTADASEFVTQGATSEPASNPVQPPVRVASQNEVNEMDLAAADAAGATDSSWLRNLFLALGGLLAVGSALRFLV
jgi:hypothetical protein